MTPVTPAPNETRLPRAVVRRMDGVRRLQAMQRGEPDPDAPATDVDAVPAIEPAATPAPPAAPAAPIAAAPATDPRENDPAYWRQRFKVTEGVLRAERQTHSGEIDALQQRITELEGQLSEAQQAKPPTVAQLDLGKYMTPEQIERIGEEDARVIAETAERAAAAAAQTAIEKITRPMQDQREREAANERRRRQQEFMDKLIELVPDYQEIDQRDDWHAWLAQENDDGVQRQAILNKHTADGNAVKVAKMFKDFAKSVEPPPPPIAAHAAGGQGDLGGKPKPALLPLTKTEIRAFYKDASLGKVTQERRAEFEARRAITPGA